MIAIRHEIIKFHHKMISLRQAFLTCRKILILNYIIEIIAQAMLARVVANLRRFVARRQKIHVGLLP